MAEQLQDDFSSERHLEVVRQHIRRAKKKAGAEGLVAAITPVRDRLAAAVELTEQREQQEQDAKDEVELAGLEGADLLRTLSGRAQEYDRSTAGGNTHATIFIEGGFSKLLDSNGAVDATTLDEIGLRVRSLGAEHPLGSFATEVETKGESIRTAEKAVEDAVRARKLAEADEEIAQAALRKQYEHNYLDARKLFGPAAERLFPRVTKRRKKKKEE